MCLTMTNATTINYFIQNFLHGARSSPLPSNDLIGNPQHPRTLLELKIQDSAHKEGKKNHPQRGTKISAPAESAAAVNHDVASHRRVTAQDSDVKRPPLVLLQNDGVSWCQTSALSWSNRQNTRTSAENGRENCQSFECSVIARVCNCLGLRRTLERTAGAPAPRHPSGEEFMNERSKFGGICFCETMEMLMWVNLTDRPSYSRSITEVLEDTVGYIVAQKYVGDVAQIVDLIAFLHG